MAEYFSPGVYVEEFDNSPRSIEGVGTSTAGFIGLAEKGATVGAPVLVTSMQSFTRLFGGALNEFEYGEYRYLANSVEQFFVNGGTRCYVTRVIPADAKKAAVKKGILSVTAVNEGKWGNRIQVTLTSVAKKKMQILGKNGDSYVAKSVDGFREGDLVTVDGEYNRIVSIYDNTVVFEKAFKKDIVDTAIVPKTVVYLAETNISVRYNEEVENYVGVSFNTANPNYIGYKMANSDLVTIEITPAKELMNPVEQILGKGNTSGMFLLEGGSNGSIGKINAATFIGEDNGPGARTGLAAFVENTSVSMLAIPGVTMPEVIVALVAQCENLKNRMAVIDMPKDLFKTKDLLEYREMIDSSYAAMYHPWIQVLDRASGKSDYIPPSGAVLGVYSRNDMTRGVHKAPANETVFCTGLKTNYTSAEQDILNPAGVNLIRALPGQGIRVWGARTASSNSQFKYVNVRRLFIFVEESIKANTNWVVFEPNDVTLWQRVQMTISSFLDNMWRSGMLAGASSSEAYFVEIGTSTMTKDDIANGRLICNIGIAPSKPAEFVIFRVTQHTADAGEGGEE
ncbi:MAG: phage tail sheath subtilisin-like domain-containing protein [Clostridium sp.]|nr:phage tail sheath subtilisin-like domain-containing protein [Clostridium sp.]DAK82846.1 MAG TPA: tail sheath protein [Caudoviricetes sp.]